MAAHQKEGKTMSLSDALRSQLDTTIQDNAVVLFMKGTRGQPQCGFSATVVQILDEVLEEYETVNVLADPQIRAGIKVYSDWPTIPQLYVKGEFVGGCDIVRDLFSSGELHNVLGVEFVEPEPPRIEITERALAALKDSHDPEEGDFLRVEVSPRFEHGLAFSHKEDGDLEALCDAFPVVVDAGSAKRSQGLKIDFVDGPSGAGFKLDNPNEPPRVKQLLPRDLEEMRKADADLLLVDVRTQEERDIAFIEGSRLLDDGLAKELGELEKDRPVVFICHHGGRSQAAAQASLARGLRRVYNLAGGIDAWAVEVDPNLARY
jgi:monothiol glutaredoxin